MSQVGTPLIERTDAIELSHRGMPETAQLRKDKPHPMAPLPASLQFIQGSSEDGGLRDHEAVQVEGISIRHLRPPFGVALRRFGPDMLWVDDQFRTSSTGCQARKDCGSQ